MKPYCFVLMPSGFERDAAGRLIDFAEVYDGLVLPAIRSAGMEPVRADGAIPGKIIDKVVLERLILCDYAIADLTTADQNASYQLGVRQGVRPHSTVPIFAEGASPRFDVNFLHGLPYHTDARGRPARTEQDRAKLARRLAEARNPVEDGLFYHIIGERPRTGIARLKTDSFREQVDYSQSVKTRLAEARRAGVDAIDTVKRSLDLTNAESAILIDLFLSYRATEAYQRMVDLVPELPAPLAATALVREQLGFALNRLGRWQDAERVLVELIAECGPSSESNGILGRIYKDRWDKARAAGDTTQAGKFLRKAITTYLAGFDADWRDAYPGINAVTLMEMGNPVDPRQAELLPVVRYAVKRRIEGKHPDYWDHATLLELAVLASDYAGAASALADALAAVRESWEPKTTARNLGLIGEARRARGLVVDWIQDIETALLEWRSTM